LPRPSGRGYRKYNNFDFSLDYISMPYCNLMVHVIWSTKLRSPLITKELKPILLKHIKNNSVQKGIFIDCMNCTQDHIHILLSLGADQAVSKVVGLIKGESSNWVNKQKIIRGKFEWQEEYIALSVSQSVTDKVRSYIEKQEEHHKRKTFIEEYDDFMKITVLKKLV
jgi:putative transposase